MHPTITKSDFQTAKKSKSLSAVVLQYLKETGKTVLRLCIDQHGQYSFVEREIALRVESYDYGTSKENIRRISFHRSTYKHRGTDVVKSLLRLIKDDSDVTLRVIAFNSSEWTKSVNAVRHDAYLVIDGHEYFFDSYVGANNTASPVQY